MTLRERWWRFIDHQLPGTVTDEERPRSRVFMTTVWLALGLSGLSAALAAASSLAALAALNAVQGVASLVVLRRLRRAGDPAPTVRASSGSSPAPSRWAP